MTTVKDRKLISMYGSRILDGGFYSLPNLILDYQKELDLSNAELVFYIKVTHFFKRNVINDSDLNMPSKNRALRNVRKSLVDKGYLRCDIIRDRDGEGKIKTVGIRYDWSGLIEAMERLPSGKKMPRTERQKNAAYIMSTERQKNAGHSLYGKEGAVKESRKREKDAAALILQLTKKRMDGKVAEELVEKYPYEWIMEKITAFEKQRDIKNPGAWLRKTIEANDGVKVETVNKEILTEAKERYKRIKEMVRDRKDVVI